MDVLVIAAHPNPNSFCHAIRSAATTALRSAGHQVTEIDLYAAGFIAAMSAAERTAYHSEQPILDPQVQHSVTLLQRADVLVFIYPTWWSSLPAILKGWLERVMVPGVGFVFNNNGKVRPGLSNIKRIVGISTYGSPRLYVHAINDNGRRILSRALRLSTGPSTRMTWLGMYAIDQSTGAQRQAFLDRVARRMAAL